MALWGSPARADVVTGQDFINLARSSVDVLRLQQYALKSQMDRDSVDFFYEATVRSMKATFVASDGGTVDNDLARMGGGYWFGSGEPRSGDAYFFGVQFDAAVIGSGTVANLPLFGQGLLFAGAASHGYQASLGIRGSVAQGVDSNGQFYPGVMTGESSHTGPPGFLLTLQHAEGLTLGGAVDTVFSGAGTQTVLASARALFQPEAMLSRAGLEAVGVPSVGVDRLAKEIDYYGDRYAEVQDAARAGREPPTRTLSAPTWEIPVALDDIAKAGFRLRAVTQVSPTPLLRLGEIGFAHLAETWRIGGRAAAFKRGSSTVGGGEGFLTWVASPSLGDGGLAITFSWSRNVPDSVTFFPIPNATVLGLQFTVGPPEMARPLIPLLARMRKQRVSDDD